MKKASTKRNVESKCIYAAYTNGQSLICKRQADRCTRTGRQLLPSDSFVNN